MADNTLNPGEATRVTPRSKWRIVSVKSDEDPRFPFVVEMTALGPHVQTTKLYAGGHKISNGRIVEFDVPEHSTLEIVAASAAWIDLVIRTD